MVTYWGFNLNNMNELLEIIFGEGLTIYQLLGYFWFFAIGYVLYGLNETTSRDVKSTKTPRKWNWKFWFYDNWRRYLVTIITTYVFFRFYEEVSGHSLGYFDAVTMGLIGDGIGAMFKKKVNVLGINREKLMSGINEEEEIV